MIKSLFEDICDPSHSETPEDILRVREKGRNDGFCEIRLYNNKTLALAKLYPAKEKGDALSLNTITSFLLNNGIVYGVKWDGIQQSLAYSVHENVEIDNIIFAQGKQAKPEVPEHYVVRKDIENFKIEIDTEADRIDWRSISTFTVVSEKDIIARLFPKEEGENGYTVFNQPIPYDVKQVKAYVPGTNVLVHSNGLFALKNGHLSITADGTISVDEVLVLKKGVDFSTGNITFPGDVIIEGEIADGFKIFAGKSLLSKAVIDVSEIVVKQDVVAPAGIIGRFNGRMRIGGSLSAKFIQNCHVIVRNDINVSVSIVKSVIFTMGQLILAEKTRLLSSEVTAVNGLSAWDIGSVSGSRVKIMCGVDFASKQELDNSNEIIKSLTMKIQKLEILEKESPNDERALFIMKLKTKKIKLIHRITNLMTILDKNENAVVKVAHEVFPGTIIEICRATYTLPDTAKHIEFFLDKAHGIIASRPLS